MNIRKKFTKYVSLNIMGSIGLSCYILADTFFIARALGGNGLAALNLSIPVYSFINATGLMLGIGGGTNYSIFKSQKKNTQANQVFSSVAFGGLLIGFLAFFIGLFFSLPLAKLLGADSSLMASSAVYLKVLLCFSPFFILNNIMISFVRNDKNPGLSMKAMISGSLFNIVMDYILIFPCGLGMFGAALATGFAPIVSLGVLSLHVLQKKNEFSFSPRLLRGKQFIHSLSFGLSAFINEMSSGVVLIVFNFQLLKLAGNTAVAAYGIIANISLVCLSVFTGIAQGIQPLASHAYGGGQQQELNQLKKLSVLLSLFFAALFYLGGCVFSAEIIGVFNGEGNLEIARTAQRGIFIYFAGFLFAGINIVIAAYLSASSNPQAGFWISITRGLLAILPLALILPNLFGIDGVWLSFVAAEGCAFILVLASLIRQRANNTPGLAGQSDILTSK